MSNENPNAFLKNMLGKAGKAKPRPDAEYDTEQGSDPLAPPIDQEGIPEEVDYTPGAATQETDATVYAEEGVSDDDPNTPADEPLAQKGKRSLPPAVRKKLIKVLWLVIIVMTALFLVKMLTPNFSDLPAGTQAPVEEIASNDPGVDTSGWQQVSEPEPPDFTEFTDSTAPVELDPTQDILPFSTYEVRNPTTTPSAPSRTPRAGQNDRAPGGASSMPRTPDAIMGNEESELDLPSEEAVLRQAAQLREIRALTERVDGIDKRVTTSVEGMQKVEQELGKLSTQVSRVILRMDQFMNARIEAERTSKTHRPNIALQAVVLPRNCHNCIPYAEFTVDGKPLSLANGDTYGAYNVQIEGNRVILSNADARHSYFPED